MLLTGDEGEGEVMRCQALPGAPPFISPKLVYCTAQLQFEFPLADV